MCFGVVDRQDTGSVSVFSLFRIHLCRRFPFLSSSSFRHLSPQNFLLPCPNQIPHPTTSPQRPVYVTRLTAEYSIYHYPKLKRPYTLLTFNIVPYLLSTCKTASNTLKSNLPSKAFQAVAHSHPPYLFIQVLLLNGSWT